MIRAPIPIGERYRNVALHDQQDHERLAVVRVEIDEVYGLTGQISALFDWAAHRGKSPESRLLAAALVRAEFDMAIDERRARPNVDLDRLAAVTAGLATARHRRYFDSMFAPCPPPGALPGDPRMPVLRSQPLRD